MINLSKIQDPENLLTKSELKSLEEKLSKALTKLYTKYESGGDPFLFAFLVTKPHVIVTEKVMGEGFKTCATDGLRYYWDKEFFLKLSIQEVIFVLKHEAKHIIYKHTDFLKEHTFNINKNVMNIAMDYYVNFLYEKQADTHKTKNVLTDCSSSKIIAGKKSLKQLLNDIKNNTQPKPSSKFTFFSDTSIEKKSIKDIYNIIMKELKNKKVNFTQNSIDLHIGSKISKEELQQEIMKSYEFAKACGSVPGEIEDIISKLKNPRLSLYDYIKNKAFTKANNDGLKNDWTRFRRRSLYIYEPGENNTFIPKHKLFQPKRKDIYLNWVAMLDTSGSMSDEDLVNAVSELQTLVKIGSSEGLVVPCDAIPYWDKITKINNIQDLKRTSTKGRGGTVFTQFFTELPKKINKDLDAVIILTDGYIYDDKPYKKPNCETYWVIFNNKNFKAPFGKVIYYE